LPTNFAEAKKFFVEAKKSGLPYFVLGGGSNSLVWDGHYKGSVFNFSKLNEIKSDQNKLFCGAGADNTAIAEKAYDLSLEGCAWMNRLPGQIGGTVRMNARCYGGEISQIVSRVSCLDSSGNLVVRNHDQKNRLFKGYKDTVFMSNQDIIVGVELDLQENGNQLELRKKMDNCERDRIKKDQFVHPSCGCVFKNDYEIGLPSGMLLQEADVQSMTVGGASISPKHSNFIYNQGATSYDILLLSFQMQEKVWDIFGVWLSYEMEVLGELPTDLAQRFCEKRRHQPNEELLTPLRKNFIKN
jgi:UDP-N-acetylmuramate dehydrogenase